MWQLVLTIGLRLIDLFVSGAASKESAKARFRDFVNSRKKDHQAPVEKKTEYEDLKKKLEEPNQ